MKRFLLALAALGAGVAVSHRTGSVPEVSAADSPLAPCGPHPNCARISRAIPADADTVRRVAEAAVRSDRGLVTGRPEEISLTAGGLRATYRVGPFTDDLAIEITPGASGNASVLHLRSASRTGRSDLGVNRRRVLRLVTDVLARVGA
ncbi:MAG: DUF1499 domain-containing protein [Bacteroidota bacterium]